MSNIEGKRFGRLVVVKKAEKKHYWVCKCSCGTKKEIRKYDLLNGKTRSCGCLNRENLLKEVTTHGKTKTPTYKAWCGMKGRCNNTNDLAYERYGGRGIRVCNKWMNSFENFYKDMGGKPKGMTLERVNNDKGYSPNNCKWATAYEQNRNKRNNRIYNYQGESKCMKDWSIALEINYQTLCSRLKNHPPQIAFNM